MITYQSAAFVLTQKSVGEVHIFLSEAKTLKVKVDRKAQKLLEALKA